MKKVILDFKGVKSKQGIFDVFQNAFLFSIPPKNFDSLDDSLSSLSTESKIYIENFGKIEVQVKNLDEIRKASWQCWLITNNILRVNKLNYGKN